MRRAPGPVAAAALALALVAVAAQEAPPAVAECVAATGCTARYRSGEGRDYFVDGNLAATITYDGNALSVICEREDALESPALPRFPAPLVTSQVTLSGCRPPRAGSLAGALRALRVSLAGPGAALRLLRLPRAPPLAAAHLAGLPALARLQLQGDDDAPPPAPDAGFLAPLGRLRALDAERVRLPPAALLRLPPLLQRLRLHDAGLARLPRELPALPSLTELDVAEEGPLDFEPPPRLTRLSVQRATRPLRDARALTHVLLDAWQPPRPPALQRCAQLQSLTLLEPAAEELPPRWVASCPLLASLVVQYASGLTSLPSDLLRNASALASFALEGSALKTLPPGLFSDARNLRELRLSNNHLAMIQSEVFSGPRALQALQLDDNWLDGGALPALAALTSLTQLSLARNSFADVCPHHGDSPLLNMKNLRILSFRDNNITHVCRDWRLNMTLLETLDLCRTNISVLTNEDLRYNRNLPGNNATVFLNGTLVTSVRYDEGDRHPARPVRILLNSRLTCDCRMYWTRRALDRAPDGFLSSLRCRSGRSLADTAAADMVCEARAACAAPSLRGCACAARPLDGARRLLRVTCERGARTRLPALPAARGTLYQLRVPHNNISVLRAAELPPDLQELDLSHNNIDGTDEETARAVESRLPSLRLRLAHNPLACACAAPLLRALRGRAASVLDLADVTCGDGAELPARCLEPERRAGVPPGVWLAIVLVLFLIILAVSIVSFLHPECWLIFKLTLRRRGLLPCWREDDDRRFDAFVSFSHLDSAVVAALVARLEGGPAPYRLCLHYRDWVPGRWIPEQIAESVRQSRRTLALVSRHFLESTWARAEFREAHAHALRDVTPRLVLVLLEEPAALPLDAELRRYLGANTYVRWGDPWFWHKLRLALPPPRPAQPPAPADVTTPV